MARRTQFRLLVALTIVWALWAGWSLIGGANPYTLRVIDDVGTPIAAASIGVNDKQTGTTGEDGTLEMEWNRSTTVLEVSAPGHVPMTVTVGERPEQVFDVVLKARILRGHVVDAEGLPVEQAQVVAGSATGNTDAEGRFSIRGAEPGEVEVTRPAWIDSSFHWDGGVGEAVVEMKPFVARAVHVSGEAARDDLDYYVDMADQTDLNAMMIDLKDETGSIWYESEDPTAKEIGAVDAIYDLDEVVAKAHGAGLYLIGRIVAFADPIAARAKPSMAVWDSGTDAPYQANGQFFLDPTDPDARAYALSLAGEACGKGVDEIQFDYVRFPDARSEASTFDGGVTLEVRVSTITDFLMEARDMLHPLGCALAADVFGFTTAPGTDDGGVGQRWEDVTQVVDVASPMVYPSHYGPDWYGFENPNDHPGPMVSDALEDGLGRLPRNVVVRPWLQDFGYTPEQVRAQIQSAEEFGLGWMLWNAKSVVTTDALTDLE